MRINLNADLGESFGPWPMGDDRNLLAIVDTANVACGFHAGDPLVMRCTVQAAREHGVSIGAHPGFPDLQGFGRRPMTLPPAELEALLIYQLAALEGMCRAEGTRMTHVKPHGALNNMAAEERSLADTIARAICSFDDGLILLAPALSKLSAAGDAAGLATALEIFADRAYSDTGALVSRGEPGAVLDSTDAAIAQVRRMIDAGGLVSQSGKILATRFHSICVHGDTAHAVHTAAALKEALGSDGHSFAPLPEVLRR